MANTVSNSFVEMDGIDEAIIVLKALSKKFSLDLSIQLAQCLRKQGKYIEAKKSIGFGLENDYRNIFKGVCNKLLNDNLTGKSFSEALILASVNSQHNIRLFFEFPEKYKFTIFCIHMYKIVFFLFCFDIQNNICTA